MANILLCADELHASLAAVRGLHDGGHVPYLAVCTPDTYASYSRFTAGTLEVPDPDFDPEGFAMAVLATGAKIGADAILPGTETSLVVLARYAESLPTEISIGAPSADRVLTAVDKSAVMELARKEGLLTPPTRTATPDELRSDAAKLEYPLILKPPRSRLPTGENTMRRFRTERIDTPAELARQLDGAPSEGAWLVQPFLDATLSAIGGVAWEGEAVSAVHQQAQRIWPPHSGYSSYAETVPTNTSVEEAVRRVLAQLQWSGIFEFQFIRAGGENYFIDFNPRLYGSIGLAIGAGMNLPAIWADLVLGKKPRVSTYRPGTRYRMEHNDFRAIRRLFGTGAYGAGVRALLPRRNTVHGVFSLRDPGPARTFLHKVGARARQRVKGDARSRGA